MKNLKKILSAVFLIVGSIIGAGFAGQMIADELEAKKITVLGKVYKQLPFEIQTSKETREDVRLK